jgi:hypothetical protein
MFKYYDPVEGTVLLKRPNSDNFVDITDGDDNVLTRDDKTIISKFSNDRWNELKKFGAWSGKKDRLYISDQKEISENNKAISRLRKMYENK